jgi:2'-5' RNA ligase
MNAFTASSSGTALQRVFVAARPPDGITPFIEEVKLSLGFERWKWMRPRNLHITACFIGDVYGDDLDALGATLSTAIQGHGPIMLSSEGLRWMPEKKPRMLWWRYRKNNAFTSLYKALHKAADPFKLKKKTYEPHPWPHITLARFKGMRPEKLPYLPDHLSLGDFEIRELALWLSVNEGGQTNYQITSWQYSLG